MSETTVYLVLGCRGSGRFAIVSDLIEFGADKDEISAILHSPNDQGAADEGLALKSRQGRALAYEFDGASLRAELPSEAELAFVVADGVADPADFVEAFHAWLEASGATLGRVLTVLNTGLALERKEAFKWFDCCIHFSDVVLLGCREKVTNKQMKALLEHYTDKECLPCLFEYVKKGRVPNPSLVLELQARRLSRIFEKPEVFEDDEEEDLVEEQLAGDLASDPYLRRVSEGRRARPLPDIADFI